ncbi:MAG: GNAT family N-acetyltransferase [Roseiflexaceae bacterium]
MPRILLQPITRENWRATLSLAVQPDQQRFIADHTPIAAIVLAKAYIRPDGLEWAPYAIYAAEELVGLVELAYEPDSRDQYWVYHFFIDYLQQGKGYGKAAFQAFIQLIREQHPDCQQLNLTVHPENSRAQRLYTSLGFQPDGRERWDEPVYSLAIR